MPDLCFVMMPFGEKVNVSNVKIDFDSVYRQLISPAVTQALLKPIRDDEKKLGGLIIKTMFERIIFCDYAIADITYDNPNVFYELGIRHAVRPFTTIIISEKSNSNPPFDLSPVRIIYYEYDFTNRSIVNREEKISEIAGLLKEYRKNFHDAEPDSPIKQLFTEFSFPQLNELRNACKDFEDWVSELQEAIHEIDDVVTIWKDLDARSRRTTDPEERNAINEQKRRCIEKIKLKETLLQDLPLDKYALLLSIVAAYKDTNSNEHLIRLLESIPQEKREKYIELEERLASAYKRARRFDAAKKIIEKIILTSQDDRRAIMNSMMASIYKHESEMLRDSEPGRSRHFLKESIKKYTESFDANPNEYYPGICLLNLVYISGSEELLPTFHKYLPLVEFSIMRRLKKTNEYWGYVSLMELEVIRDNQEKAMENMYAALSSPHAPWKREITARHIKRIYEYKSGIGQQNINWIKEIVNELGDSAV